MKLHWVATIVKSDIVKVPILAVHHDSQWGQAEIYLKDVSWQRQMSLIYLFKILHSGIALGETYLISQWTLEGYGMRVDKHVFFSTEIQFIFFKENVLLQKFQKLYEASFLKVKWILTNQLVWQFRVPSKQEHQLFHRLFCWRNSAPSNREMWDSRCEAPSPWIIHSAAFILRLSISDCPIRPSCTEILTHALWQEG